MEELDAMPVERLCNRHDGRGWRCKRPVMDGKSLCEIHYAQGRLRSSKKKVPDSLKLLRPKAISDNKPNVPVSSAPVAQDGDDARGRVKGRKRKRERPPPDDDEDAEGTSQKKVDTVAEEVLMDFVKSEVQRKKLRKKVMLDKKGKEKKKVSNGDLASEEKNQVEVARELPYGRMAISPSLPANATSPTSTGNAAPPAVNLGLKASECRLVNRKFRSKNVERPPIITMKAVPYAGNVRGKDGAAPAGGGSKRCHWCKKDASVRLSKCLSCKKRFFCSRCVKERSIDAQEVKLRCPVCRGICECKDCLCSRSKDEILRKQFKVSRDVCLHYLIGLVFPILEKINVEQRMELERESKFKGFSLSEVEISQVKIGAEKQLLCNRCNSPLLDFHRSCPNCSYSLCLSCCQESSAMMLGGAKLQDEKKSLPCGVNTPTEKTITNGPMLNSIGSVENDSSASLSCSKACDDDLCCPSSELGGCGSSLLDLKRVFPWNYIEKLETSAKEIIAGHDLGKYLGRSLHCSLCASMGLDGVKSRELLQASRRKHPGDNYLYCPSVQDDYGIVLPHFQKHWGNSHPVIVRDVVTKVPNLSWDPVNIFSSFLNMLPAGCENKMEETFHTNCMDWYEVHFNSKESFSGSCKDEDVHLRRETLNLKAKLCSALCWKNFRDHYSEIFDALLIHEYTNPRSGLLNLAAKLSEDSQEPELDSYIYVTCGDPEELWRGELVSGLCYCSHDLVNVLVHASDFMCSADQLNKIRTPVRMNQAKEIGRWNRLELENGMTKEHSEITEDAAQPNQKMGKTPISKGVSSCLVATGDLPVGTIKNLYTRTMATGSETESDSSIMCSSANNGAEKLVNQMLNLDCNETSTAEKDFSGEHSSGIQWDIFRRQDTPKLLEYLQKHSDEFSERYGSSKLVLDSILDGRLFLDTVHKIKLKDEFKIEPWTFVQRLGEAVLIPAGCPYQMKNLKSCVNVVVGFVSPENAAECIKLNDQIHAVSRDHKAKISRLEVNKMAITKIEEAIAELQRESVKCPFTDV